MSLSDTLSFVEPITEPEVLEGIAALPTEEDLPCDDGEPMETPRHREQMWLLIHSLPMYWSQRTDYYVTGNMFLHYDLQNRKKFRGPDFFLVLDVEDRERKSWVVWQEGMRFPDVIIDLLSDTTRGVDKGEKKSYTSGFFAPKNTTFTIPSHKSLLAIDSVAPAMRKGRRMSRDGSTLPQLAYS